MRRVGQIINLKPDHYAEYSRIHARVWPGVLETIQKANIRNYPIYHWNGMLFAYFEYVGADFETDMGVHRRRPKTRERWLLTDPMQTPVQGNALGSAQGGW